MLDKVILRLVGLWFCGTLCHTTTNAQGLHTNYPPSMLDKVILRLVGL